ncbi:MAG TPA: MFS transporter [Streptosporangiaceae bacterium]
MAAFINVYGTGLILTVATLYGIRVVHLTAARTGLALTIALLVSLMASIPTGRLADRRGPKGVFQLALVVLGCTSLSYAFLVHNFVTLLIVTIVDGSALNSSSTAGVALMRRVGGDDATTLRSQVVAVLNLGISLGVATCAIAIQLNTVNAYRALFLGNAIASLAGAALLSRLPRYEPLPGAHQVSPLAAIKDKAFVGYTALSGAMTMQGLILAMLMPIWVVFHTNAPRWSVSAFLIINTLIVFLFQVRVGKRVKTLKEGGAAFRRAGVIFLFSCSAIGLATGLPGWGALLLLVGAVVLLTYGELWQAAGQFALDFGLAPAHAQGQYQGLVSTGNFTGVALAPLVLAGLVLSGGRLGFILLGAWFALLGMTGPAVARWGERTRPAAPAPAPAEPAPVPVPVPAVVPAEPAVVTD